MNNIGEFALTPTNQGLSAVVVDWKTRGLRLSDSTRKKKDTLVFTFHRSGTYLKLGCRVGDRIGYVGIKRSGDSHACVFLDSDESNHAPFISISNLSQSGPTLFTLRITVFDMILRHSNSCLVFNPPANTQGRLNLDADSLWLAQPFSSSEPLPIPIAIDDNNTYRRQKRQVKQQAKLNRRQNLDPRPGQKQPKEQGGEQEKEVFQHDVLVLKLSEDEYFDEDQFRWSLHREDRTQGRYRVYTMATYIGRNPGGRPPFKIKPGDVILHKVDPKDHITQLLQSPCHAAIVGGFIYRNKRPKVVLKSLEEKERVELEAGRESFAHMLDPFEYIEVDLFYLMDITCILSVVEWSSEYNLEILQELDDHNLPTAIFSRSEIFKDDDGTQHSRDAPSHLRLNRVQPRIEHYIRNLN